MPAVPPKAVLVAKAVATERKSARQAENKGCKKPIRDPSASVLSRQLVAL